MKPPNSVNLYSETASFSGVFRFFKILLLAASVVLTTLIDVNGQSCSTCTGVTSFTVDISANPDTSWSTSSTRNGQCCQGTGTDKCIVFYVTVNPNATEIMFVYRNGAANNGAYQINCTGPAVAPGTPLCLSGLTTFCITYCNPGNSSDAYTITTSSGFTAGDDLTLRSGCTGQLTVSGLLESSLTWSSVYPGVVGAYNSYLSCAAACDTTNITPGAGAPAYVDYKVCGARTGCSLGSYCDTQRVYMTPVMSVNITPANPVICAGDPNKTITANVTGGSTPYTYNWSTGATTSSITIPSGTYTVTVSDTSSCPTVSSSATVTSQPASTADAGSDAAICSGATYQLAGAFGGSATSSLWSTSGTGTFDNTALTNATYTPSAADIAAGNVTLTITAVGPCTGVNDAMVLTISQTATVGAGSDATICAGSAYTLAGTRGGSATSSTWSTSGTGTFNNASSLTATYTPSAADITAGNITLTITTDDPAGPCSAVSDNLVLTINSAATVNAGTDNAICSGNTYTLSGTFGGSATSSTWSTSGTGIFNDATSLTATYTPSAADILAGTVNLTLTTNDPAGPCNPVNDFMVLAINPAATINAGSDASICTGNNYTLSGSFGGSATSSTWSTSGTGTFNDATSLTAIYMPSAADITAGNVTLTITTNDPAGPCPSVSDAMVLTINPAATVSAGIDATICSGTTHTLSGTRGGSATSSTWSTSGSGTFNDATSLTATYTPSATDITAGTVTLTLTTDDPAGTCPAVSDVMILTINPAATVNAGSNATICSGTTHTLSGTRGGSAASSTWSSSGTGTFSNASSLTPVYTPSAADITAGTVTLTITTNDPAGPCPSVSDAMVLTINPAATVSAGSDATICSGTTHTLSGTRGGSAISSTWSTSGSGTFNDATSLTAIYTPSAADITAGTVTLTLTTDDPAGTCPAVSDVMILTINPAATVNAGSNATICSGTTHTLSGTRGGSATSSTWTTSGTGTFNDATSLTATYTPSAADITAGTVTLTITTNDPAGPCPSVSDAMVLTINPAATVSAGIDATICSGTTHTLSGTRGGSATSSTWSTSGTGTFSNTSSLTPIYTPSASDITAGTVTLTITTDDPAGTCPAVSDVMILTINPAATVNAGSNATICSGTTLTLSGTRGGSATSSTWSSSGTGTFSNASSLTPVYTPSAADITAGTVTLTITTNDPAGPCPSVSDAMVLTINPAATVSAGSDATICSGTTHTLSGTRGGSAISSTWSTSGSGTFNDATSLTAIYTPSAADITAGTVTLTLTTDDPAGTCPAVSDVMILTINPAATVNAGSNATICSGTTHTLSGTRGGSATSTTWSTSGSGTFSNASSLTPVYTPSAADITAGTVTLTITTNDPAGPCPSVSDAMVLTINPAATVSAGSDATICSGTTHTLSGTRGGSATSSTWSTSGSGTFSNTSSLTPIYTPSASDLTAGTVTLTITTDDPAGTCPAVSDVMILTINPAATVNAGSNATICSGTTHTLSGTRGGSATSSTWLSSGTGTFNDATSLTAIYTPSAADITAGSVTLTITTNDPAGPCPSVSDAMVLTINPAATVSAGSDATICSGTTHTLSGTRGGSATSSTWSTSGTGSFNDATSLTAIYTPSAADITAGTVTLTLTTDDPAGTCPAVSDVMILTINPAATVNAGSNATICSGTTHTLSGTRGGSATSSTWTSSGTGTFNDATSLTATYTPSAADITAGTVTLTITTNDPAGPCPSVSDAMVLTINPAATVSAGSDATICSGTTHTLSGTRGGSATSSTWSTSGGGTFNDATSLTATYTPSATDITAGTVTLTITTDDPAGTCPAVSDVMILTINPASTVNAGSNATICSGTTHTLSGTRGGSATSTTWSSSGTGTFSNASSLTPVYTPSAADITAGTVTLTITTNDPAGPCPSVSDAMVLTINPAATVSAGSDATICSGTTHPLSGTRGGSATSSTWSTSGTGTFNDATSLTATYTPSATDITAGTVTLTITTDDPAGTCPAVSDVMILTINQAAIVTAGNDTSICSGNNYTLSASIGGSATSLIWTTSGTGTFSDATSSTAIYTPSAADISAGTVTLTITTNDPAGLCSAASDAMVLSINPAATVSAGIDATICAGTSFTLSGFSGGSAISITWTSSGTGSFDDPSSSTATYTPSVSEIAAGFTILTITTNDPAGVCPAVSDAMILTINPAATVSAGNDVTICSGATHNLTGTRGGSATSSTWSTSGTGTFSAPAQLNTMYSPSPADIAAGTVTLTLTTNDPAGPCPAVSDAMLLTIDPTAIVSAGSDATICSGAVHTLSGSLGGSATTSTWSTSGTGTFDDATLLAASYTPSAADITAGTVTLAITTDDPAGVCTARNDVMILTINPAATVSAGNDTTICSGSTFTLSGIRGGSATSSTWSTSGTGSFDNTTSLTATYTPSATDIASGTVTLTITTNDPLGICTSVSDALVITINPSATVSAGNDATICSGTSYTLSGTRGGSATSSLWTSSGTGTFDDDASLTATYTPSPGDITAGLITLTLTTNDPAGTCPAVSDQVILNINPAIIVDAGNDTTICSGSSLILSGTIGGSATTSNWSTSGTGIFDDVSLLNAAYTPSALDIANGTVTLTLITNDPAGPCPFGNDAIVLTINQVATIAAGNDATICGGTSYILSGSLGGSATSSTWTTSGTGTFDNAGSATATYTPSAADITGGSVTLTLSSNDPAGPCPPATDDMVLIINSTSPDFSYASSTYCQGVANPLAVITGTPGGTFSGPAGIQFINNSTGEINLSASSPGGPYTITYTTPGACPASSDFILSILAEDDPSFSFSSGTYCQTGSNPIPVISGTPGGIFSGPAEIVFVNTATGEIDLASSTPGGPFIITYTTSGACPHNASIGITIASGFDATFTYNTDTYCQDGMNPLPSFIFPASAGLFSATPGGLNFVNVNTGEVNLAASINGTYIITNDIPASGGCPGVFSTDTITINNMAIVSAGSNATICQGNNYSLSGSMGGSTSGITWTTNGSGTFDDSNSLTAIYTPSSADFAAGNVILTITSDDPDGSGPCTPVSSNMSLTLDVPAWVNAGPDITSCHSNQVPLTGTRGGTATSSIWSTSGSGTFNSSNSLTPVYTPSASDINAGTIILTLTSNDPAGPCDVAADSMVLTINKLAFAVAGPNTTICAGDLHTLAGSIGGSATSLTWTTFGSGTFDNPNSATATYTPSSADITAGSVTLLITTNDPDGSGPCNAGASAKVININPAAVVSAGTDSSICSGAAYTLSGSYSGDVSTITWTTSGTGTFDNNTLLNATYTPSPADTTAGTVTLIITSNDPAGPCPSVSDTLNLQINPYAIANAGANMIICEGSDVMLSGTLGGSAASAQWTTSGTGAFDDASLLNATYTPSASDITAGNITLTLTSDDPDGTGPCSVAVSSLILTINPAAIVDAGPDTTICSATSYTLGGSLAGDVSSITWSTTGSGTFDNTSILNATYTPSAGDITTGNITLIITSNDPIGPCESVSDSINLQINTYATVNAGADETICSGSEYTLSGSIGGSAATATWTTNGSGVFDDATLLNATYTPSAADISAGGVILTLTTNDPDATGPCTPSADVMVLSISITGNPTFAYGSTDYCSDDMNPVPAITGTPGGTFSEASGNIVFVSVFSGEINITASTPGGPYEIIYTTAGSCYGTSSFDVTINAIDDPSFSYSSGTYCLNAVSPVPTVTGTPGGLFSEPTGNVVLDTNTGEINLNTSTSGTYSISYTTPGSCPKTSSATITITDSPDASFTYAAVYCQGDVNPLPSFPTGSSAGVFSASPVGLSFINTSTGEVDLANSSPGSYTITNFIAASGGCDSSQATAALTINERAIVQLLAADSICAGNTLSLLAVAGGSATSVTWTTSGSGTFDDNNSVAPAYTPSSADILAGTVNIFVTTNDPDSTGPCSAALDATNLTIIPSLISNAGSDTTVCNNLQAVTLNGTITGGSSTATWTTSGTGIFTPDNTTLNAEYYFSAADTMAGSVDLVLTLNSYNSCSVISDTVTVTLTPMASAFAGNDTTVSSSTLNVPINGSINGGTGTGFWTTTGTGIFIPSDSALNAVYQLSSGDILSGSVTLSLTPGSPCNSGNDAMIITINSNPIIVNAGINQAVCEDEPVTLNGAVVAANGGLWSTSGNGSFIPDDTTLNAVYVPGSSDVTSGNVVIYLTSTGNGMYPAVTDSMEIVIHSKPLAEFVYTSSCIQPAIFTDVSTIANDSIIGWYWEFGDGNNSTNQNPSHSYSTPGTYPVMMIATSSNGCVDTTLQTIVVNPLPAAYFTATLNCAGDPVNFTDSSAITSGTIISWNWDFGDSTIDTIQNPSHIYAVAGTYTVTLVITSDSGCMAAFTDSVTVVPLPEAAFTYVTTCSDSVTFTDATILATGSVASWNWDFGDGMTSIMQNPVHSYSSPGTYITTLVVISSNGCSDTTSQTVTVNAIPVAGFTSAINCATVTLTDNSIIASGNIVTWTWNLGDGNVSSIQNPVHQYTGAGIYTITLTITSDSGCMDTYIDSVTVMPLPQASFNYTIGCSNTVTFTDSSSSAAGTLTSWNWDFGDGQTDNTQNPLHVYANSGSYTVTLEVTNSDGCSHVSSVLVMVTDDLIVDFTPAGGTYMVNEPITFTDQSSTAVSWIWNMGDSTITTEQQPVHSYSQAGIYLVQLIATNSLGCIDSISYEFEIKDEVISVPGGTIAIPSAFTPDQDGNNDVLLVRGGPFVKMDFRVFNEWGNELFHSNNQASGWDGTYKGKKQQMGTYIWTLAGTTVDNRVIKMKGDVTILK